MARSIKTPEQKVEELDRKIAGLENKIATLKAKRDEILHPLTYQDVIKEAKKRNLTPKKLAAALGMSVTPGKNHSEDQMDSQTEEQPEDLSEESEQGE